MDSDIENAMIDAVKSVQATGKTLPTEFGMSYQNWKAMGGVDLSGTESGGGFVWVRDGVAEYIIINKQLGRRGRTRYAPTMPHGHA